MPQRVVVIGAGPGGLATAALLARQGADVTVLERGSRIGGRSAAIEAEGFRFDTGPTFFLYPKVLEEICAACGEDLRSLVRLERLDPQYRLLFGAGGSIDATPDLARMEAQIAAISPQDAKGFRSFMADNRRKFAKALPLLTRSFLSLSDLASPDVLKALPILRPLSSVYDDLGRHFQDERVRLAFTFQAKYLGMSPFRCPSLFSILSFLEYEYGVWHPIGGCAALMDALAGLGRRQGVEIRCGAEVTGLRFRGRRPVAAMVGDEEIPCDALVVNADFSHAMRRLVPDQLRRAWSDRRIAKARFSCSTFMLYLGIDGGVPDLRHHTISIPAGYRGNLADIEDGRLTEQPCFYVQNASATDPSLAPPGCSTLYVLSPMPNNRAGIDWASAAPRLREHLLDRVEALGVKGLRKRIRVERCITPADWESQHAVHLGATFNLAHDYRQMLLGRPRNRYEDLDGTYIVGGGTHPGSGLPVIFESARIAARLAGQELGLQSASSCRQGIADSLVGAA